jgi:hypothetical protein
MSFSSRGITYGSNVFQYGFSKWYFWLCYVSIHNTHKKVSNPSTYKHTRDTTAATHALVLVTLHDAPLARVNVVLHHVPPDGLNVLGVDLRGLDELVAQTLFDVLALLGVQVHDDGVDHGCLLVGWLELLTGK